MCFKCIGTVHQLVHITSAVGITHSKHPVRRITLTIMRATPSIPIAARWMRTAETLSWWSMSMLLHNIIGKLCHHCLDPSAKDTCVLPVGVTEVVCSASSASDLVPALDFKDDGKLYAKAVGIRVSKLLRYLAKPTVIPSTVVLSSISSLLASIMGHWLAQNSVRHLGSLATCLPGYICKFQD